MIYACKPSKISIYHNTKGETPEAIKAKTGCNTIVSGIMFNGDGSLCGDIRKDGVWLRREGNTISGIGWSGNEMPKTVQTKDAERYENFLTCFEVGNNIKRGRAAIGFRSDDCTILAVSDGTGAMTIPDVHALMKSRCDTYLILDGGGSVYMDSPSGKVDTSLARKTQNRTYLLIWEKAEPQKGGDKKMKICIDPGHGYAERSNQSPDGRYFEYLFTFDFSIRLKKILERCGFEVMLTKETAEETPGLTERANRANAWGADIYLSPHTNATGGSGWNDVVTGITTHIYGLGGVREAVARALIEQFEADGIKLFGSKLYTDNFTVLAKTNMPAVLVEYGFHTSRSDVELLLTSAHRDRLAVSTAKALCKHFKVAYIDEPTKPAAPADGTIYRVQVGAFTVEQNAENLKAELESKGYKPFIVKEVKA